MSITDKPIDINKILDHSKETYPGAKFEMKKKPSSMTGEKVNVCKNIYNSGITYQSQFPKLIKTMKKGIFRGGRKRRKSRSRIRSRSKSRSRSRSRSKQKSKI